MDVTPKIQVHIICDFEELFQVVQIKIYKENQLSEHKTDMNRYEI